MIPFLLIGAAAIIGGLAIAFWDEIVGWIKRAADKVFEKIQQIVVGVKIFVKKISEAIKEISKHYSQNDNGKWNETVVTREISESEVPKDILAKAKKSSREVDISNELELQLN